MKHFVVCEAINLKLRLIITYSNRFFVINKGVGASLYKRPKSFLDCLIEFQKADPEIMTDEDIREEVDTAIFAVSDIYFI